MLRTRSDYLLRGAQGRTSILGFGSVLETTSRDYSSLSRQNVLRTSSIATQCLRCNGFNPWNVNVRSNSTAPATTAPPPAPVEEEERVILNPIQKKALKMWAMRDKELRREQKMVKPKRGWMNSKYNNLKIEDVIHFICLEKGKHQQITYDLWMHNYKYKLYTKGIIFLFHLNDIPYGKPWRALGLSKGCFFFLEKVREGIYDNYLEELYKARPPADPSVVVEEIMKKNQATSEESEKAEVKEDEGEGEGEGEGEDEDEDEDEDDFNAEKVEDSDAREKSAKLKQMMEHIRLKVEVEPKRYKTRVYTRRSPEALKKLQEWKKQRSAEKVEAHKQKLREDEEEWRRAATPAWLIKAQAEKAARAAAAAAAKKGKR